MSVTVVIPIFNDFESLEYLYPLLLKAQTESVRFLIVDNGSTDRRVVNLLSEISIASVRTEENLGFGGGIIFGISSANSEWVSWMPGNLKVLPGDVVQMIDGLNLVQGTFYKASRVGRPFRDNVKTFIAGAIQSMVLRTKMFDTGGTPTVCERGFVLSLDQPPLDYVFESYTLYCARKSPEVTVLRPRCRYGRRMFGTSHWQRGIRSEFSLMVKLVRAAMLWTK